MITQLLTHLPQDFPWGSRIHWFASIDSTNTRAKAMAAQGAPHGTVLLADCQTGGRGRLGRSFQSPAGVGIYLSVILRPRCPARALMHLTCATAEAMCDAVEAGASFRPGIKWTNDLVFQGRKLAGILTELSLVPGSDQVDFAVIGIGVNCCQQPEDFSPEIRDIAGSLAMAAGHSIDRPAVAAAMLRALYRMDGELQSRKPELMARYRRDCVTIGQRISLVRGGETRHGQALDVDDDGALVVAFDSGGVETVASGEVSIRGMYGYV